MEKTTWYDIFISDHTGATEIPVTEKASESWSRVYSAHGISLKSLRSVIAEYESNGYHVRVFRGSDIGKLVYEK